MLKALQQLLALFLTLLVGNPACCCTLDSFNSGLDQKPTSSCCCSNENSSDSEETPSPPHQCACEPGPADISETNFILPKKPSQEWLIAEAEFSNSPRISFPAVQIRGPNAPLPEHSPPHRSLHQVFLL